MTVYVYYCPTCHDEYKVSVKMRHCPVCGARLVFVKRDELEAK